MKITGLFSLKKNIEIYNFLLKTVGNHYPFDLNEILLR